MEVSQLCKVYTGKEDLTGWFCEPKINGNRGLVIIQEGSIRTISRNNKPIYNTEHIQQELSKVGIDNVVLDGELYTKKGRLNEDWSTTTSILRTQTTHPKAKDIKFHVFDIIPIEDWSSGRCDIPLRIRKGSLFEQLKNMDNIICVEHKIIGTKNDVQKALDMYMSLGWEGVVLKDPNAPYEKKRAGSWLKLKRVHTEDFTIVGFQEGMGKYVGTLGAISIIIGGKIVGVGTGMTDEERDRIWDERKELIGREVEISYQTKTREGSLIFPVFCRIRYDLM